MESFGPLKAVYVARDDERPGSNKGYGFCEYVDGTKTDPAIAGLDGLAIGEGRKLSVRRASTKNPKWAGGGIGMIPGMQAGMGMMPGMMPGMMGMMGGMGMPGMPGMAGMAGMPAMMGMNPMAMPPPGMPAMGVGPPPEAAAPPPPPAPVGVPTRVVSLYNMVTEADLKDDTEYAEILEDVVGECQKHGVITSTKVERERRGEGGGGERERET
jgi:hypothetical protein